MPDKSGAGFTKLASASQDAFGSVTTAENEAIAAMAAAQIGSGGGSLTDSGCDPILSQPGSVCVVSYGPSPPLTLSQAAPQTRQLIGVVARYGEEMADLAAAKDIEAAGTHVDGIAKSIAAVATIAGAGPIAVPVSKLLAAGVRNGFVERRRQILLAAALEADPAIRGAADKLAAIASRLRSNIETADYARMLEAKRVINVSSLEERSIVNAFVGSHRTRPAGELQGIHLQPSIERLKRERADAATEYIHAASDIQRARTISTDYSSLTKAHQELIEALRNPRRSITPALVQLNGFVAALKP